MNKIVRDHYPASKLPDDLRGDIDTNATVRIIIEQREALDALDASAPAPALSDYRKPGSSVELADLLAGIRAYKQQHGSTTDSEEAVRRIRELRNEWDDE